LCLEPIDNARLRRGGPASIPIGIHGRKPSLQIGYTLLKSKLGEFTGLGEDIFFLPRRFCVFLARWEAREGESHYYYYYQPSMRKNRTTAREIGLGKSLHRNEGNRGTQPMSAVEIFANLLIAEIS
jgi:hypothetical protein